MATDIVIAPPLVSCLMVTLPVERRFVFACAAIDAYCSQTYPCKELVLVISGGDEAGRQTLINHVASLKRSDIRPLLIAGNPTLGLLRNASLAHAKGDIVCQWDDDDLHHPERLQRQTEVLLTSGHDAVLLQDVMQFFPRTGELYWTNWRATEARGHPGTLMAKAAVNMDYPEEGDEARLGEDLRVVLALHAGGRVAVLEGMPYLFVYVSHDHNSWDKAHHRRLAEQLAISTGLLRKRQEPLRQGLRAHNFAGTSVQVMGRTGPAFAI